MATHAGRDDEAARLAFTEMQPHGAGAVVHARQVRLDDLVPLADGRVEDAGVGGAAGVGDEDVDLAKVGDDVLDQLLDLGVVAHVALVRLGLDAVAVGQVLGVLLAALRAGGVGDGDVGPHLGAAAGGFSADAGRAGGAGDDDHLPLEGEEVLEVGGLGDGDGHFEEGSPRESRGGRLLCVCVWVE